MPRQSPSNLYESLAGGPAPDKASRTKKLVLIRHGRTYMNDFIKGVNFGSPGFTDIFPDTPEYQDKYRDSPLGPTGRNEVNELSERIENLANGNKGASEALSLSESDASFLEELELIVTSPLTRALQTLEMGLYKHVKSKKIPCVALPLATERFYLVSDLGKPRSELRKKFCFVDFDSGFDESLKEDDPWYFVPTEKDKKEYVEWRPHGEGQVYSSLGEPQHYFDKRMTNLFRWLQGRDEKVIALVCHHGVIKWLLNGEDFKNCELRVLDMDSIQPKALVDV